MIWIAWLITSLFYTYQYIFRVMPNIIMPELVSKFDIGAEAFGQFAGIYYITYALAHIPIGTWLDKKGPKYVVPSCLILTILGTLPLIFSESWLMVCIGRAVLGFGSAGAILGLFKVIHLGFPRTQFARVLGIGAFLGLMGAIYGGKPVAHLVAVYGYTTVIKYLVYIGLAFAIISFFVMPKAKGIKNDQVKLLEDLAEVWKHKNVIYLAVFAGLMVGPLEGFADAWGAAFMQSVYHMDKATSSFLTSLMFLGMAFGSSIVAYIGDKTKAYYQTIIWCAFIMASIFAILLIQVISSSTAIMAMFMTVGVLSGYQVLSVYVSTTFVKEGVIGLTTAIVNMIVMSFGYLFHSVIGKILSLTWNGEMFEGVKIYTPESYVYSIYVIPVCLVAGGLGFFWLKVRTKQR